MASPSYTILIADDETELMDALAQYFRKENLTLVRAENGAQALELFDTRHPDLVLLDIMMPDMDGYSVLNEIRKTSQIPAIMLTALSDPDDKIRSLSSGADDYITKPYDPREVLARVKAQLRRPYRYSEIMQAEKEKPVLNCGSLILDTNQMILTQDGKPVQLSATELRIMELLMSSPGKIFTKRQIYESAWSDQFVSDDNTIMVRISSIRHKIHDDPKSPRIIVTVKGLGYKFEVPDES